MRVFCIKTIDFDAHKKTTAWVKTCSGINDFFYMYRYYCLKWASASKANAFKQTSLITWKWLA